MSHHLVAILVLVVVFLIATIRPVNMGALSFVAVFVVGLTAFGVPTDEADGILDAFPGDLFLTLVAVTYVFAIAKSNGTVDWLVQSAVRAVGGRVAAIPWAMFGVCAVVTAIGAVSPAAVAIIAPVGMRFAERYGINRLLMGLMIINGASAGSFSPIGIFGITANGVVADAKLPSSPFTLFLSTFLFNVLLAVVVFVIFDGRRLLADRSRVLIGTEAMQSSHEATHVPPKATGLAGTGPTSARSAGAGPPEDQAEPEEAVRLDSQRIVTLVGLAGLIIGALGFGLEIGFVAMALAVLLTLAFPQSSKDAVNQVSWGVVLLITGIVTYVNFIEDQGTVEWLGESVSGLGAPLLTALLICFIGGVVSAFASTTGIIGALIPLAVPFLLSGQVGAIGMIAALSISSSVVDSSPFSTNGALVVANAREDERDHVFRRLMVWGMSMVISAPILSWLILVVPGWL